MLLSSHNDEADLLLQIGSAPERLYREYVAENLSKLGQFFEFMLLRPFVHGAVLKAVEMFLERFSLGFPVWKTFLFDYEVAPLDEQPYYPPTLLVQHRIEVHRKANAGARLSEASHPETEVPPGLRVSLQNVIQEMKRQIQLRHSSYYEDPVVVRRRGEFIAGGQVELPQEASRPFTLKPSGNFWEGLLAANIGVAALCLWMSPEKVELAVGFGLLSYAVPLGFWMLVLGAYWAWKRHWPPQPWRYFWAIWAIFVALFLLLSFAPPDAVPT